MSHRPGNFANRPTEEVREITSKLDRPLTAEDDQRLKRTFLEMAILGTSPTDQQKKWERLLQRAVVPRTGPVEELVAKRTTCPEATLATLLTDQPMRSERRVVALHMVDAALDHENNHAMKMQSRSCLLFFGTR
jgi:hypothetical protein